MRTALRVSLGLAAIVITLVVALVSDPAFAAVWWGNPLGIRTPIIDATSGAAFVESLTVACSTGTTVYTYDTDIDLLAGMTLPSIGADCDLQLAFDPYIVSGQSGGASWSIRILNDSVTLTPEASSVALDWETVSGSPDVEPTMQVDVD